jgi:hypothetical protein
MLQPKVLKHCFNHHIRIAQLPIVIDDRLQFGQEDGMLGCGEPPALHLLLHLIGDLFETTVQGLLIGVNKNLKRKYF